MLKQPKLKARQPVEGAGLPWIVPGFFIGLLVGAINEVVLGVSMFRMIGCAAAGLLLGAIADFIRGRIKKRKSWHRMQHKTAEKKIRQWKRH